MALYTYLAEFKGGFYVHQVEAGSLEGANALWLDKIFDGSTEGLDPNCRNKFYEDLVDWEKPVSLDNKINVWNIGFLDKENNSMDVYIVKTEKV